MATLLFRLDANTEIGYGHLARQAPLATALACQGHRIRIVSQDRVDKTHWFRADWRFMPMETDTDLFLAIEALRPDALICDLPAYSPSLLERLRFQLPLVVFDDYQTTPLPADLLVNTQINWRDDPADARQRILGGPEFALIRVKAPEPPITPSRDIVLTMGGSDSNNVTEQMLNCLRALSSPLTMSVIVGPGYTHHASLNTALANYPHDVAMCRNVKDMAAVLCAHRLAISAVGITLYELAMLGVPTLAVVEDPRQSALATAMQRTRALRALSLAEALAGRLVYHANALLADADRRAALSHAGRALVDGRGADRLVRAIEHLTASPRRAVVRAEARTPQPSRTRVA